MGEEIGLEMAFRTMNHLLQYGEPVIRKTVPLAIGLLSLSNPQISVMDMLTKLTYDPDKEVAQSAIFALGLISAGSNNSRLAEVLRQIASYSHRDNDTLFMVRIAQGLLQMGKGLVSIHPIHSDKLLLSNIALAGVLASVFACTNLPNIMFANYHYLIYTLALAASPRICMPVSFSCTYLLAQ
jgi:26S proteasome regulatory subunit N1